MESILTPPRRTALDARTLRIVEHRVDPSTREVREHPYEMEGVVLCEPVRALKQRIALKHADDPTWFPEWQFIARKEGAVAAAAETQYTPLEFAWPFPLRDPLAEGVLGIPDARLYEEGERTTVHSKLYPERTLELALGDASEVHVWTLGGIAAAHRTTAGTVVPEAVYEGFYKLYSPTLEEIRHLQAAIHREMTAEHRLQLDAIREYIQYLDVRYAKINAELHALGETPAPTLSTLHKVRFDLPAHDPFTKGLLELKFYEMKPVEAIPFLRFFPAKDRGAPLVQTGTRGSKAFLERSLLELFMKEEPEESGAAAILLKSPVVHKEAPSGTTWTLTIYEGGRATILMRAPRVDKAIPRIVVEAAFAQLPAILEQTPWRGAADRLVFSELTAQYECTSKSPGSKPTQSEIRKRADVVSPFFMMEKIDEKGQFALRYKPVSDYVYKKDPVTIFITRLLKSEGMNAGGATASSQAIVEGSLAQQFGMDKKDAAEALTAWEREVSEEEDEDKAERLEAAKAWGIPVIIKAHPSHYLFTFAPTRSLKDLQRMLDLLALLISKSSEELAVAGPAAITTVADAAVSAVSAVSAASAEAAAVHGEDSEEEEEVAFDPMREFLEAQAAEEAEEKGAGATGEAAAAEEGDAGEAVVAAEEERDLEEVEAIGKKGWQLKQLQAADKELFKHTGKTSYSRACQKPNRRFPHVMDAGTYSKARAFYGDTVNWVESPLSAYDNQAVDAAASAPDARKGATSEVVRFELRALELGFPLKPNKSGNDSVTQTKPDASAKEKADIEAAKKEQAKKTLLLVVRAGTNMDKANYYICGDLWCVKDDMPVDPRAFAATSFQEKPKPANTCPKCKGVEIKDEENPAPGETVWRRETTDAKGVFKPSQPYAGYQEKILAPDPKDDNKGYVAPCCFLTPTSLKPPADAKPIPKIIVKLPETQRAAAAEVVVPVAPRVVDENTMRPFSATTRSGTINQWFIPTQNIQGRGKHGWLTLNKGDVAVPPTSVNVLLGQPRDDYLSLPPGRGGPVNTHLVPGTAFLRYSLGTTPAEPGHNLLALIAFAMYATEFHDTRNNALSIKSPKEIKDLLCESDPTKAPPRVPSKGDTGHMIHAFEQANYGTLLHEFSTPGKPWTAADTAGFNADWMRRIGFTKTIAHQRPYLQNLYKAWRNFENYIRDPAEPKALSTWEGLLGTPGLLTRAGVILVRIRFPKNRDEPATIQCPRYGIAPIQQESPPPFLFVVEDEESGRVDPLVLYNATSAEDRHVYGIVHHGTETFRSLPKAIQTPLSGFLKEYTSASHGCGRLTPPPHPWMPVRSSQKIPGLSDLLRFAKEKDLEVKSILRDITNRLVGVIVKDEHEKVEKSEEGTLVYVPALDDGTIVFTLPVLRGDEAIPEPPFDKCVELLMGKQPNTISERKLAGSFPGLKPVTLVKDGDTYVGLELDCGAEIKIEPTKSVESKGRAQKRFGEFVAATAMAEAQAAVAAGRGVAAVAAAVAAVAPGKKPHETFRPHRPWTDDTKLLLKEGVDAIGATEEEKLEDAYQHLRISFSNWLFRDAQGAGVLRQIELLRQARKRLPLFELQKRLEILLTPIIANTETPWITTEGHTTPSILRRDCLQIETADKCVAGCVWATDKCLIHTSKTPRYVDPIRVMTARLADELIRTFGAAREVLEQKNLPFLKSVGNEIVYSDAAALFSTYGRGDRELYRKLGYTDSPASEFGRGLTYPEEKSLEQQVMRPRGAPVVEGRGPAVLAELSADWAEKLQPRVFAAAAADAKTRFVQVLVELTGASQSDLEKERGAAFTGTSADWAWIAREKRIHIITTREIKGHVELSGLYAAPSSAAIPRFVILSPDGVPYVSKPGGSMKLKTEDLPGTVQEEMRKRGL